MVPYISGKIWSARLIFLFFWQCMNISTVINIKILTNSNQQTQSYKFTNQISAFLSVVLITEMLELCKQTSYDQNVQLILKSYLPVVYGTPLNRGEKYRKFERGEWSRTDYVCIFSYKFQPLIWNQNLGLPVYTSCFIY